MVDSKASASASGGGLSLIIILSLVAWTGLEMEPRPAVWWGIKWTLYTYLMIFGSIITFILGVAGVATLVGPWRSRHGR